MQQSFVCRLSRAFFWAALLFAYLCAIVPGGPQIGGSDKDTHGLAFATLMVLACVGWPAARWIVLAGCLVAFGIGIELSQALPFIHRDAEIGDVAADVGGILIGSLAGLVALALARRIDRPVPPAR